MNPQLTINEENRRERSNEDLTPNLVIYRKMNIFPGDISIPL